MIETILIVVGICVALYVVGVIGGGDSESSDISKEDDSGQYLINMNMQGREVSLLPSDLAGLICSEIEKISPFNIKFSHQAMRT
ncbi:hypothetical protein [Bermanella sp. R86510]|uniref:hypothetical protein n=1 Tax=unclassified Bermanella TaxID=2627862 RepID=UPI0037CAE7F2